MNAIKIIIISLILLLLTGPIIYASDVSDADFEATITTTNDGTGNTSISSNISGLSTPYLIDAGFLNSSANNCAMQTISGADIAFMPGYDDDPWVMYNGDIGSDTVTMSKAYFKNITDGKICMFLDSQMTIAYDAGMDLSDNYSITFNDVMLVDSDNSTIMVKAGVYSLTYSYAGSGNLTWYSVGTGNTLSHALDTGEHDIVVRALPSGATVDYTLRPEAEGDLTEVNASTGAFHYTEVDDIISDEYATWVISSGTGAVGYERDLYEIPNTNFVTVNSVTITARCKLNGPLGSLKLILKTGGTVYESPIQSATSSWDDDSYTWNTNPSTGLAWSDADIDNLQIGISLACGEIYPGMFYQVQCTQCYVTVNGDVAVTGCEFVVDGESLATTVNDLTITDNANDVLIGSPCVAYLGQFIATIDGVDKCSIDWEYGTTFTDDSGNGNDVINPPLRISTTDPDVTSVVTMFAPTTEFIAPAYAVEGADFFDTDNITASANFTSGNTTVTYPGSGIIDAIVGAGTPQQIPQTIISMFIIVAMGLLTGFFLRNQAASSMVITFLSMLVVMAVFVAMKWWDWWQLIFWLILIVPTLQAAKERREA